MPGSRQYNQKSIGNKDGSTTHNSLSSYKQTMQKKPSLSQEIETSRKDPIQIDTTTHRSNTKKIPKAFQSVQQIKIPTTFITHDMGSCHRIIARGTSNPSS